MYNSFQTSDALTASTGHAFHFCGSYMYRDSYITILLYIVLKNGMRVSQDKILEND